MKRLVIMLMLLILSLLISIVLYLLSFFVSFKVKNMNKLSPFECGFSAVGFVHTSFSVHFFIILIMFVIFDLEVVLLVGCLILSSVGILSFLLMMFFVVGGIYLEWYLGKLKWMV